jgi:outer membrane biosynthesis protein TonB
LKAKFKPAVKNGEAIRSQMFVNFQFPQKASQNQGSGGLVMEATDKAGDPVGRVVAKDERVDGADSKPPSERILNGKVLALSKPPYPAAARAVQANGSVQIRLLIDTNGSVYSAEPVSGHPLLRSSARAAACSSKFSPTLLGGQPIKVAGILTYNFVP